jgi:hypothetical protein
MLDDPEALTAKLIAVAGGAGAAESPIRIEAPLRP